ncbi:putative Kinase family protein with leucine-rich repeat domain [Heracleum sosnowskyi]|uniref:Kinase family protein with leucine-rich repeat domain n=1 Tax=Heracleum sosnowskyi TaxID=360622 RepID=A0AAD8IEQ1_9APIA|nr:putative Kinase family protein with leucine-rich repeat domain [Heracleum sosnowskyi]
MERTQQEEMKFHGVFGIFKEGHKIMAPYRRLFNEITLAFILPLSIIYLAEIDVSSILHFRIALMPLDDDGNPNTSKDWASYVLYKLAYYTFLVIFSLLSTSAVVYSIACIYANRDISLKKVIGVVPKVWKRLMITFVVTYGFTFIYIVIAVSTMGLCLAIHGTTSLVIFFVLLLVYIIGFVYLTIVWQLASVVTVLEDSSGVKAMKKSINLIKGKFWVALAIFLELIVLIGVIEFVYYVYVVDQDLGEIWKRLLVGISCLVLLVPIFLYGLVLQTIIYFVCKSHHNETIDKPTMSNHLGGYERLYSPDEVQMEQV